MSFTLKQLRDRIINDLDLQEETWVINSEIDEFINDGIEEAESEIHTIYEDYFLVENPAITITAGDNTIDYPADIYANKIRKIVFSEGSNTGASHTIRRIKDLADAKHLDIFDTSDNSRLWWSPINDAVNGRKIRLFPAAGRNGLVHIFYLRNAKRLALDTDVLDIDEFQRFVRQVAMTKILLKDGDVRAEDSVALQEKYRKQLQTTLMTMAPDDDNEIESDYSHYDDSYGGEIS